MQAIERLNGLAGWAVVAIVVAVLAACWTVLWLAGGATHVSPHLFYIPIVLAGVRFGPAGAVLTALASTILAGPLLPADVQAGTAQATSDWLARGVFFVGIGLALSWSTAAAHVTWRAEADLHARQRQLQRQRAELVDIISHELRTPVTVLVGGAEILARPDLPVDAAQRLREGMNRSKRRIEQLLDLITVAADAAVMGRMPHEPVDLTDLCKGLLDALDHLDATTRLQLELRTTELVTVRPCLQAILQIVIDNALKFSPPDTPVDVASRQHEHHVRLFIRDRGPGIDPALLDGGTQPFHQHDQTDRRTHSGLGLGLHTAHQLLAAIGATIHVDQPYDGGTLITIDIPQRRDTDRHRRPRKHQDRPATFVPDLDETHR